MKPHDAGMPRTEKAQPGDSMTARDSKVPEPTVAIDASSFRHVLGHLATGVTVITAHGADGPVGMAANSVGSVSLNPPLILFCPARSSETWPAIRDGGAFCVNVIARHHEKLARQFAAKHTDRFRGVDYQHRPTGPALTGAVAWIECQLAAEHEAGDHTITVARVVAIATSRDVDPLVFFRGTYGSFQARRGSMG